MNEDKRQGYVTVNVTTIIKQLTDEDRAQIGNELVEVILRKLEEREKQSAQLYGA